MSFSAYSPCGPLSSTLYWTGLSSQFLTDLKVTLYHYAYLGVYLMLFCCSSSFPVPLSQPAPGSWGLRSCLSLFFNSFAASLPNFASNVDSQVLLKANPWCATAERRIGPKTRDDPPNTLLLLPPLSKKLNPNTLHSTSLPALPQLSLASTQAPFATLCPDRTHTMRRQLCSDLHPPANAFAADLPPTRPDGEGAEDFHIPRSSSQVSARITLSPLPICATSCYFHRQSAHFKTSSGS